MISDYLFDTINFEIAFSRIFDRLNFSDDVAEHSGVFEGQITVRHLAIDELEILSITEWLVRLDCIVDEGHVLTVPTNVFTFDNLTLYNYIFVVPKSVFCIKL